MSAVTLNMNTFKVIQLLLIPGGEKLHLVLIALEDIGAIIIDTNTHRVLQLFNIAQLNPFPEQTFQ